MDADNHADAQRVAVAVPGGTATVQWGAPDALRMARRTVQAARVT